MNIALRISKEACLWAKASAKKTRPAIARPVADSFRKTGHALIARHVKAVMADTTLINSVPDAVFTTRTPAAGEAKILRQI